MRRNGNPRIPRERPLRTRSPSTVRWRPSVQRPRAAQPAKKNGDGLLGRNRGTLGLLKRRNPPGSGPRRPREAKVRKGSRPIAVLACSASAPVEGRPVLLRGVTCRMWRRGPDPAEPADLAGQLRWWGRVTHHGLRPSRLLGLRTRVGRRRRRTSALFLHTLRLLEWRGGEEVVQRTLRAAPDHSRPCPLLRRAVHRGDRSPATWPVTRRGARRPRRAVWCRRRAGEMLQVHRVPQVGVLRRATPVVRRQLCRRPRPRKVGSWRERRVGEVVRRAPADP